MRTTIEIPDHQRAKLLALAAERGLKGFSPLVEEALERYLAELEPRDIIVREALGALGSLDDDEAAALEESVAEIRGRWR